MRCFYPDPSSAPPAPLRTSSRRDALIGCLGVLTLLLLWLCAPASAEEFPPSAQLPALSSQLGTEAIQTKTQLSVLLDIASLEIQADQSKKRFSQVQERFEQHGDLDSWNSDRLLEMRRLLQDENSRLERILENLSVRLEEVEQVRRQWEERREFWQQWGEHLTAGEIPVSRDLFGQVQENIRSVIRSAESTAIPLAELHDGLVQLHSDYLGMLIEVDTALRQMRGQIFQRTGHPIHSPDFLRQINEGSKAELRRGLTEALRIDLRDFHGQLWILIAQILGAFGLATFIRRHKTSKVSKDWLFILDHPWATGIFASMVVFGPLFSAPPALLRLLLWILLALSAAVLIAGMVRNPLKRFTVFLLAAILLLSLALQLINLPAPLYRLYIAAVSLGGIPLFLLLARHNIRRHQGQVTAFSMGLRLGALICLVSFLAQAAGYSALSASLVDASIRSVFIIIFAVMAALLGQGGIDFLLDHPFLRRSLFVRDFGSEVGRRLKTLLKILVGAGAFYHFLVTWGIYDSFNQAWDDLTSLGIAFGQIHLSAAMVLLSLLVIYLAIQISWVLRAVLDSQVFPHSGVDRGVSDAIKKLVHYFLVFLGFLLAVSVAGIELRNFAVLAGAFGIGIGFGLQNIVNNFVSGLILLFERPVKVGDMVVVEEEWGTVVKIGLRSTIIETFDRSELIVPNSLLISEKVTNWTHTTTMARVKMPVGVAYGSDVGLVLSILQEAGDSHPLVLPEPAPSPIFIGFGDSSLDFELRCWIADVNKRLVVRSEIGQFIDRRFREEGVEIPFPQRDLHLRSVDGEIFARAKQASPKTPDASDESF